MERDIAEWVVAMSTPERIGHYRVAKSLTRIPLTLAALVNTVAGVLVLLIFVYPFRYWVTGALCFTLAACVI
jgi:hypothetical protein